MQAIRNVVVVFGMFLSVGVVAQDAAATKDAQSSAKEVVVQIELLTNSLRDNLDVMSKADIQQRLSIILERLDLVRKNLEKIKSEKSCEIVYKHEQLEADTHEKKNNSSREYPIYNRKNGEQP